MIVAQAAMRAWANAYPGLVGDGNPLAVGAFLDKPRSPLPGAYALVMRQAHGLAAVCAEAASGELVAARMQFDVWAGEETACEKGAAALADAITTLRGDPQSCGAEPARVLVHDNLFGPVQVPVPPDASEPFCFQVAADFILAPM